MVYGSLQTITPAAWVPRLVIRPSSANAASSRPGYLENSWAKVSTQSLILATLPLVTGIKDLRYPAVSLDMFMPLQTRSMAVLEEILENVATLRTLSSPKYSFILLTICFFLEASESLSINTTLGYDFPIFIRGLDYIFISLQRGWR